MMTVLRRGAKVRAWGRTDFLRARTEESPKRRVGCMLARFVGGGADGSRVPALMPPGPGGLHACMTARDGTQQTGGLGSKWAALYTMFVAWKHALENTGRSWVVLQWLVKEVCMWGVTSQQRLFSTTEPMW